MKNKMKIEFDLPNFEKELNINIVIRKDGEVVYSASSSFPDDYKEKNSASLISAEESNVEEKSKPSGRSKKKPEKTAEKVEAPKSSGNFMNMDF